MSPRAILFLFARGAARHDPHLAVFQQRLQKAGKAKMVTRIALAGKLIVILNAQARDALKARLVKSFVTELMKARDPRS